MVRPIGTAHIGHIPEIDPEHCAPSSSGLRSTCMPQSAVAEPTTLLERDHELGRVRAVLHATARHGGEALVIEGAAGMGKSRLLEEARVRASELGIRVLNARATELERRFPFGVMRQLFERPLVEADSGA